MSNTITRNIIHKRYAGRVLCSALAIGWKICYSQSALAVETNFAINLTANGELAGNQIQSRIQLNRDFQVSSFNAQVSGETVQSQWGDVSARWDDLSFAGRSFRGFQFGMPLGKATATLLGGTLAVEDLRGRSHLTPAWGLRTQWPLQDKLSLSLSQLWMRNQSSQDSISALALRYQPSRKTNIGLEAARSDGGHAWQIGAIHQGTKVSARALWRQADAKFSLAGNPNLNTQKSGYLLNLQAQRIGPFSANVGSQRFDDQRGGRDNINQASLSFSKSNTPSITLFWHRSDQLRKPFFDELDDTENASTQEKTLRHKLEPTLSQSLGLQISHSWPGTSVSFGYERQSSELRNVALSKQESDRFSLRLNRRLGQRSSLSIAHSWNTRQVLESNARSLNSSTSIRWQHRTKKGLGLSLGLLQQQATLSSQARKTLSSQLGVSFPVGSQTSIGLEYQHYWKASGPYLSYSPNRLQIRLSQRLNFGGHSQFKTREERRKLGSIAGIVFDDANANGRRDVGEATVSGVTVAVRSNLKAQSDTSGAWNFSDLQPGKYKVQMVVKTVPIEYSILAASEQTIDVQPDTNTVIEFPVVKTGEIRGIVFHDINRNGKCDENEKPITGAVVSVDGLEVISFTDENGKFSLVNLPPRPCTVRVATDYLPSKMEMTTSAPQVSVQPGLAVEDLSLGLMTPEQEVVTSFSKNG